MRSIRRRILPSNRRTGLRSPEPSQNSALLRKIARLHSAGTPSRPASEQTTHSGDRADGRGQPLAALTGDGIGNRSEPNPGLPLGRSRRGERGSSTCPWVADASDHFRRLVMSPKATRLTKKPGIAPSGAHSDKLELAGCRVLAGFGPWRQAAPDPGSQAWSEAQQAHSGQQRGVPSKASSLGFGSCAACKVPTFL